MSAQSSSRGCVHPHRSQFPFLHVALPLIHLESLSASYNTSLNNPSMVRRRLVTLTSVLVVFPAHVAMLTLVTPPPPAPTQHRLQGRDAITALSTCGFLNGDPSQPWVAPKGFNCRVDTLHGIWGFCPTTVISATDCGLGAFCFDAGPCSSGCGRANLRNNPQVRTWRW